MLEKPDVQDETILRCVQDNYDLPVAGIEFLPVGGDQGTAVYRIVAGEAAFFCKLRRGTFDESTVALPRFLHDSGITAIIAPLKTASGQLSVPLAEFRLILYPFVTGTEGYEVELTEQQWHDFGAAMRRIHTTPLPPALSGNIAREDYSPAWRERCRRVMERLDEPFEDAISRDMVALLLPRRDEILSAVDRADELAQALAGRSLDFVLCHSDIHPGNLLITPEGFLYIVDWDYPMLAPRERDLMFIGGGQGFLATDAELEERLFYRGYGSAEIDPVALTYFRYERGITDITVESERVLSSSLGDADRAQSLVYLGYYCLPGNTLEIAAADAR